MTNQLFYGDNPDVLRDCIASESIDLIYLGSYSDHDHHAAILGSCI